MCKSCASCVRILMIIFNIIFTIVGIVVLGGALYFYFTTFGMRGLDDHNILAYTFIVLALIGGLSVVLGILGCCGSYHYSRCLLGFYFVLLLIVFAAEIAIGVAGFVHQDSVRQIVHSTLAAGVEDLRKSDRDEPRWMDVVHVMLQCCGFDGPSDYLLQISDLPRPDKMVTLPRSCCPELSCSIKDAVTRVGCKDKIDDIMHNFSVMCIAMIVIALVELFGLVSAMTLCCAVSGRESRYYEAVRTA